MHIFSMAEFQNDCIKTVLGADDETLQEQPMDRQMNGQADKSKT